MECRYCGEDLWDCAGDDESFDEEWEQCFDSDCQYCGPPPKGFCSHRCEARYAEDQHEIHQDYLMDRAREEDDFVDELRERGYQVITSPLGSGNTQQ